jgi:glycosyltransferase involved in cell wall biosynthesis
MVTNLGLSHRVIFTGFRRDIPQIMKVSNVIVHSASKPEPLGRVVAEAMMAGRPVIATNAGGVVDSVINDFNGKLVPLKDASAMAEAICDLLADQVLAQRLGQQAQQFVKKRFSVKKHVEAIQNIYSNILNEKASFTSKTHILKS